MRSCVVCSSPPSSSSSSSVQLTYWQLSQRDSRILLTPLTRSLCWFRSEIPLLWKITKLFFQWEWRNGRKKLVGFFTDRETPVQMFRWHFFHKTLFFFLPCYLCSSTFPFSPLHQPNKLEFKVQLSQHCRIKKFVFHLCLLAFSLSHPPFFSHANCWEFRIFCMYFIYFAGSR